MSIPIENISSLPHDVFAIITANFDLADLCSLRLTSHNLHAIATTSSFKSRFHSIRTDLSNTNLQALIAICSSPDLGHLIQKITILAKHYDDRELRQQIKDGTIWKADPGNGPIFSSSGHRMTQDEKVEAQSMFDEITKLKNQQAAVDSDGSDVGLLSEAFNHLGSRSVDLSVEAAVHVRPQGPRLPIAKCRDREGMSQRMDHAVKVTVAALSNSQLHISNLSVFDLQWGGYLSMKGLHDALQFTAPTSASDPSVLSTPPSLHQIQSLILNLHPAPTQKLPEDQLDNGDNSTYPIFHKPSSSSDLYAAYLRSLAALIEPTASCLETLDIRFRGFHPLKLDCAAIFSHLAAETREFSRLSTLHLRNIVIQNTDLLSILAASPSLTYLGLHKVSLAHNPSHTRKLVEYPTASPPWTQHEPEVSSWRNDWKPIFNAFLTTPQTRPANDSPKLQSALCPKLETLEINSLSLTSFEHRIYFSSPYSALSRYVYDIVDDPIRLRKEWFKLQAFQGLTCCVFTGEEVRGEDNPTTESRASNTDHFEPPDLGNGLHIPLPPPPPPATSHLITELSNGSPPPTPRGIQYTVSTTRPYGSQAYYQWSHFWEKREFGVAGCTRL